MERVTMPARLVKEILRHAQASPDTEVCGLITARKGRPARCVAVTNVAEQAQQLFLMDPKQQIDAFRAMREQGEELFGVYHSHPRGPAEPSATDIEQAAYPEALYLIVSLNGTGAANLCAYRLREGKTIPVTLDI